MDEIRYVGHWHGGEVYHDNSGSGRNIVKYAEDRWEVWCSTTDEPILLAGPFTTLKGAKVAYILMEANGN